jgi:hypothetical protein
MLVLLLMVSLLSGQSPDSLELSQVQDRQLIGILTASYLYQSYLNIGYLADATSGGVYSEDEAIEQVDGLIGVIGGVRDELQAYSKYMQSESDLLYVENLVKIADILLQEAGALQRYYQTGDEDYARDYLEFNDVAQRAISQLLGIEIPEDQ